MIGKGRLTLIICDALQQNKEHVAQANFEIWMIEVGIRVKNNSSVDIEIFVFIHTLTIISINSIYFLTDFDWLSSIFPQKKKKKKKISCIFRSLSYPKL